MLSGDILNFTLVYCQGILSQKIKEQEWKEQKEWTRGPERRLHSMNNDIKNAMCSHWTKREYVTVDCLHQLLNKELSYQMSKTTILRTLHRPGFDFKNTKKTVNI